ncbi:cardiolipin synthase [Marinococcus sp. PL1-022]|uniref:cardiolipin synthase n=1 Tax=Marinococcus sp. PL1-022 TaxID=3095363 RepID=UPI0029C49F74|nr:cardiolipin synthase [Marinococcus sp. PL1-022]MDX6152708.1 cardiolipin synthase [Marinococcus sp. PL1-022]
MENTIVSVFFAVLLVFNIFSAFVIVFLEKRNPTTAWAWLMLLFFLPIIGFVLYLIFGQNLTRKRLFDTSEMKSIGIEDLIQEQLHAVKNGSFSFSDGIAAKHRDLIYMHLKNNGALLTQLNDVQIFTDGRKKFDSLLRDIASARDHVHLQYYILRNDELGAQIIEALRKKAEEGVLVRVLYDDMGSRTLSKSDLSGIVEAGGETAAFFPKRLPLINLRLNYRNHRKLVIIDGHLGYIGGFNIGDEYVGLNKAFGYWRDTHLRIEGQTVKAMQTRFFLDWNQANSHHPIHYALHYFPASPNFGTSSMQIVSSGPDSEWEQIKNGYIKMINTAKHSVTIQTPYFIPDESLMDAIRIASLSGVDVRIMIPDKPDHPFVYWATYSHIGMILRAGARVYIYNNGFIHAKTITVDGEISSVGTANIDVRSFRLNFEINAFIYHAETTRDLTNAFLYDMETHASEVTLAEYEKRSLWIRSKEAVSHLLSPIL